MTEASVPILWCSLESHTFLNTFFQHSFSHLADFSAGWAHTATTIRFCVWNTGMICLLWQRRDWNNNTTSCLNLEESWNTTGISRDEVDQTHQQFGNTIDAATASSCKRIAACLYVQGLLKKSIISSKITVKNLSALLLKQWVYCVWENTKTETTVPGMSINFKKFELLFKKHHWPFSLSKLLQEIDL